jgi:hypothetical protein
MKPQMDDTQFELLMDGWRIVVVHFSCYGIMSQSVTFPNDLNHAISNYETETRSCCAIYPGHNMNLPGSVGVIFRPSYSQVLSVCSADSGSSDYAGHEGSMGVYPEEEAILSSLQVPSGMYNEWRIRGAESIGIFVSNPQAIDVKQRVTFAHGIGSFTEIGCVRISLQAVRDAFPGLLVYTMGDEGLIQL